MSISGDPITRARMAALEPYTDAPASTQEWLRALELGADAAVRVMLEHLIKEAPVLLISSVAVAYMRKLMEGGTLVSKPGGPPRWTLWRMHVQGNAGHWRALERPHPELTGATTEAIEVMPVAEYQRDVVRLAQERADAIAERNRLLHAISDAARLLTPGMKAGVGEAKAILQAAAEPGERDTDGGW